MDLALRVDLHQLTSVNVAAVFICVVKFKWYVLDLALGVDLHHLINNE